MHNCPHVIHTTKIVTGTKVDIECVEVKTAFIEFSETEQICSVCGVKEEKEDD